MEINRIKKLSISQKYTKDDIKLSKYAFSKAINILKEADIKKESKLFYNAIEYLEKSILVYPRQSESYMVLSFLFWKMNEHENAITLLKKAREFDSFNVNIPKQIKIINDDYIRIQKDKIINKHSSSIINQVSDSRKNSISNSINSVKTIFNFKSQPEKSSVSFSKKLELSNIDLADSSDKIILNGKESIHTLTNDLNKDNKHMVEELIKLNSQRENIKVKTSSGFLNKVKAV